MTGGHPSHATCLSAKKRGNSSTILEGLGHQSIPGLWSWLVNFLNPQVLGLPPQKTIGSYIRSCVNWNQSWSTINGLIYIYICKRRYIANKWEINGIESNPLILQIRQDDRLISTNLGELPNGLTRLREGSWILGYPKITQCCSCSAYVLARVVASKGECY